MGGGGDERRYRERAEGEGGMKRGRERLTGLGREEEEEEKKKEKKPIYGLNIFICEKTKKNILNKNLPYNEKIQLLNEYCF